MKLEKDKFLEIIDVTPLVSVDIIIENNKGDILLGYRKNKPAKDFWFVPGGRIHKNETINNAFDRILKKELGLAGGFDKELLGVYDHIYSDNFAGKEGVNTHYVVIGYKVRVDINKEEMVIDDQHADLKWFSKEDIINQDEVHANTKRYFS